MLLLTKFTDLNSAIIEGFLKGNNFSCDMTVEDIYGNSGISLLGLPKKILASSMGKISKYGKGTDCQDNDIMKSLMFALVINIA